MRSTWRPARCRAPWWRGWACRREASGRPCAPSGAELGDIDEADLVVLVGGDPASQQPSTSCACARRALWGDGDRRRSPPHRSRRSGTSSGPIRAGSPRRFGPSASRLPAATARSSSGTKSDLAADPARPRPLGAACQPPPRPSDRARRRRQRRRAPGAWVSPPVGVFDGARAMAPSTPWSASTQTPSGPRAAAAWAAAFEAFDGPVIAYRHPRDGHDRARRLVLPAFTMWEQEGTLVSMTGRAQRLRPGARAPRRAAAGWELLVALAHYLGRRPVYRTRRGGLRIHRRDPPGVGRPDPECTRHRAVCRSAPARAPTRTTGPAAATGDRARAADDPRPVR